MTTRTQGEGGARRDRRWFLRVTSASLGWATLHRAVAHAVSDEASSVSRELGHRNGEAPSPFTFVQLSDTHVGFAGPPNPNGTQAFERAVQLVNRLDPAPDLVLFTGDLTHDSETPGEHAARMRRFQQIAGQLRVAARRMVPGEHDAGLDGGALFREFFGETSYAFDHRGVHFVALDNVSRAKPEVGPERLAWLQRDLARFAPTTPIVVLTHRPLFDLKPEWEWFTRDGDQVMNVLSRFENVTVLYGHIHREDVHETPHARHYAARSLAWAFPDPEKTPEKKPLTFDPARPFQNLGLRSVRVTPGSALQAATVRCDEIELTLREHAGVNGFAQLLRPPSF